MSIRGVIREDTQSEDVEVAGRTAAELNRERSREARINNDIKEQDKQERKVYANIVCTIATIWLMFTLIIFVLNGQQKLLYSESVVITFLTTTTANVLGMFIIVMKYLFQK